MLGETLASTYPVVPAAIARRGVPADSRTRRDVCFNISRRPHATVRRGVPADSRIRRDVGTSTYPVVPTPSLAGASRLTRALGETRALQHIPSSLRHRPPGCPGSLAHSARRGHFNITHRPYAIARRGVPAVPAELGYSCKTFSVVCLIVVDYQFGVEFLVSWLAQWGEVP